MTTASENGLVYRGTILSEDAAQLVLRLGDGAELEVPIAGIAWREATVGTEGAVLTTLGLHPDTMLRARFAAGAAQIAAGAPETLPLIAYEPHAMSEVSLVLGEASRDWMNATSNRYANRCLPLLIANQAGWMVLNTHRFAATWTGEPGRDAMLIEHFDYAPGMTKYAMSHFGHGVLTFSIPYLFRTPPGFNLYVRGPANLPKDGIAPLSGIVETDWSDATFTMNWMFTRPGHRVVFEEDEPIAMLSPMRRGELERFRPVFRPMEADPETKAGFDAFAASRGQFIADLQAGDPAARQAGWQRDYMRGQTTTAKPAREHQTGLTLARFVEEGAEEA